ncbi:MBOAT, membrane-bound O-acyltransferase family-domain-containing protein [Gamsiella multidivaricata]|uniref:MBOAT, membrane-bound O-acyltransferase family-domain-containing protein n=1 Tax=Gamsiella multidivaricata TaxID=101098 RepID=UPI00221F4BE7|nr:MBOAT, membrane-bound O-acyltransferase family-domain-containing protein [Gamsiella multidivaricata]KAI7832438.1 MBOAT, membrane-bound O-acyltransferase family-domain-containing protein [Gamsiella multidivaricata]
MLDSFFGSLSEAVSFPEDQLRCLSTLLLAYPLAFAFRLLPYNNPNLKHLVSVLTSFFLLVVVVDDLVGLMHLLGSSIAVWRIMGSVKGKWGPRIVFMGVMIHMSVSHLMRQFHDYRGYKLDHTGPQMILTMKLTSWALSVHDGRRNPKELSKYQQEHAITTFPNLLHYLSYVFFFPAVLVGPSFEYMDYIRFIELSTFKDPKTGKVHWPAGRLAASMKTFLFSLIALASLAVFAPKLDVLWTLDPAFKALPFVLRFIYVMLSAFAARFKYYAVWKMAEGACVLAGFGYNGVDPKTGKPRWDASSNIDVWAYETGQSVKALADSWNKGTNQWLKNSVYLRVVKPGAKPGVLETFSTFAVSAFWHGFYPGYYLMFLSAAMALTAGKMLRTHLRPRFVSATTGKTPLWYNMLGVVLTQVTINYLSMSFLILTLKDSLQLWKDLYFVVHIGIAAVLLLTPVLFPVKRKSRKEQQKHGEKDETEKIKETAHQVADGIASAAVVAPTEILDGSVNGKVKTL